MQLISLLSYICKPINKCLGFVTSKFDKTTNIVFYAPLKYHAQHFYTIISKLETNEKYTLFLVGDFEKGYNAVYFPSAKHLPIYKKFSLFFSTDMVFPWKVSTRNVYFGHGVGPKLDYVSNPSFSEFDFCLCPGRSIFAIHSKLIKDSREIGLPVLELKSTFSKDDLIQRFNLDSKKPTIVYAPSWHGNYRLISDLQVIFQKLNALTDFNVVVSPHPNLFKPELCNGIDFLADVGGVNVNNKGDISSLDIVKVLADIVISDISSLLFESMALKKYGVFDGNENIYIQSKAEHVLKELKPVANICNWNEDLNSQFLNILSSKEIKDKQWEYINNYIFNIGQSTNACIAFIEEEG